MWNAENNAKAVERANKKRADRRRQAYEKVFESPEGRAFIITLLEGCGLYDNAETPVDEGRRRVALQLRANAIEYGLFGKWQQAESEEEKFQKKLREIIEQSEAKEYEY